MDDDLRTQLETAKRIAKAAESNLFTPDGKLKVVLKGPNGQPLTNPSLLEWHKAIEDIRRLSRDLGLVDTSSDGEPVPLIEATKDGDQMGALNALALTLAEQISVNKGHGLASLSKEYRETLAAIKELREAEPGDDSIGRLVAEGAARAHRLGLSVL